MFKKYTFLFLLGGMMLAGCSDDNDDNIVNLSATLNSAQEVPSNPSTATGTMTGTYDKSTRVLTYTVTYTGITPRAGHIHTGAPGSNGPVVIPFTDLASPITSTVTVKMPAQGEEDIAQNIMTGNSYVNLHTAMYPGGEIRGNIKVD